jgi:hypothetical protein
VFVGQQLYFMGRLFMLYYGKMYFAVQICGVSGWRYIVLFVVENMKLPKFTKIICGWQGI